MVRTIQKIGIFCGVLSEQITGFLSLPNLSETPGITSFTEEHRKNNVCEKEFIRSLIPILVQTRANSPSKAPVCTTRLPTAPKRRELGGLTCMD